MIGRPKDRGVCNDGRIFHAGNPVDSGLLPVSMDMSYESGNIREYRSVWNGAPIGIEAALPSRIHVDVVEAMRLQT